MADRAKARLADFRSRVFVSPAIVRARWRLQRYRSAESGHSERDGSGDRADGGDWFSRTNTIRSGPDVCGCRGNDCDGHADCENDPAVDVDAGSARMVFAARPRSYELYA